MIWYPLILSFPSIYCFFIFFCLVRILDLFMLTYISFCSAQISHVSIVVSSFSVEYPTMLVSSAKICGVTSSISNILVVISLVKMLNNKHDMLHPYPNPLPIGMSSYGDYILRLLNISYIPYITSSFMFICFILVNSI